MENLLSILTFTPLLAALILAIFLSGDDQAARQNAKWLALTASGATFFVAAALFFGFDGANRGFQFQESRSILGLTYRMGVDGVSLPFVVLITAITPIAVAMSWMLTERVKHYVIWMLTLETALLGAVLSLDLIFFIAFFELAILPALILAGSWGRKACGVSALKAWLYTVPGSILLIIAATGLAREAQTTDISELVLHNFSTGDGALPGGAQGVLWLLAAASVAVKAALWPFHTWLPGLAYRAPLHVGMLLCVLVTALGLYGLLRIHVGMLPVATQGFAPLLMTLAGLGLVLGILSALTEEDLGRLLSYVAVAQTGALVLLVAGGTVQSFDAIVLAILAHGCTLAALFALAVMLEARGNAREIAAFGALKARLPILSGFFLFFVLALLCVPGTAGFAALILALFGLMPVSLTAALLTALGALLFGALALVLYRQLMLGARVKEHFKLVADLDGRERLTLSLLVAALVLFGLWPGLLLDRTAPAFAEMAAQFAALR
ncbi:MAG: NADH-quinone oxidoreductase subunit M [Pseudomonadota bacterium]